MAENTNKKNPSGAKAKNIKPSKKATTPKKKIIASKPVALKSVDKDEPSSSTPSPKQDIATTWNDTLQSIFGTATDEIKQAQGTLYALSCERAENLHDTSDTITNSINDSIATNKENMKTFFALGKTESDTTQILQDLVSTYSTNLTKQTMELGQNLLECRTIDDFAALQGNTLQTYTTLNIDILNQLTEISITFSQDMLAPVDEQISKVCEKINSALSEVA